MSLNLLCGPDIVERAFLFVGGTLIDCNNESNDKVLSKKFNESRSLSHKVWSFRLDWLSTKTGSAHRLTVGVVNEGQISMRLLLKLYHVLVQSSACICSGGNVRIIFKGHLVSHMLVKHVFLLTILMERVLFDHLTTGFPVLSAYLPFQLFSQSVSQWGREKKRKWFEWHAIIIITIIVGFCELQGKEHAWWSDGDFCRYKRYDEDAIVVYHCVTWLLLFLLRLR